MASLPPPSFVIETERFLLRPMVRSDASAALETWIEDAIAAEMLNTRPRKWSMEEQIEYFAKYETKQTNCLLGLFPRGQKEPIGLFIVKLQPEESIMLVTHLLGDTQWRGRGASREASIGIFEYFFNKLDYKKAKANVQPSNRSMMWLLFNGGWRLEARLNKHLCLKSSGVRADILVFGIMSDEWRASKDSAKTVSKRRAIPRADSDGSRARNLDGNADGGHPPGISRSS
ncbi:GNAT family N-acetyltransferase [Taklimakanibacter lacteus]|uniref:GNAT family N-acetyltransferase n=1 Tax=Taklimakanibacter lacteus TaxID=2268456 RepID=UPI000E66FC39